MNVRIDVGPRLKREDLVELKDHPWLKRTFRTIQPQAHCGEIIRIFVKKDDPTSGLAVLKKGNGQELDYPFTNNVPHLFEVF
jgi:hypothetical protein